MDILVISLAGIGDTLFATPLIKELRLLYPEARIDALVMWKGSKDLLEGNPNLNTLFHENLIERGWVGTAKCLWPLRKRKYDISFNTHPQSRIAYRLVAKYINARSRISHEYENLSPLDGLLINRSVTQDYAKHAVDNNLALLELAGKKPTQSRHRYEIFLTANELAWAVDYLKTNSLPGRKLLGIHVGSGGTKNLALRRWPLPSYAELIRRLTANRSDLAVLFFGGPEEQQAHASLKAELKEGSVFFPNTSNLRQAAALIQKCHVFLSVDTVLMHVAAAVEVPKQVVIETPTWNKPIEPFGQSFVLVPNPRVAGRNLDFYRYDGQGIKGTTEEIQRCMESVTVDAVQEAVEAALK
jgi:ADP-heptose:LPS heptosyltransferase